MQPLEKHNIQKTFAIKDINRMEKLLYPVPAKEQMSRACMKMIDANYTPQYQERVVIQALNRVLPGHKQIPLPPQRTTSCEEDG